jgi:hypothetical protein
MGRASRTKRKPRWRCEALDAKGVQCGNETQVWYDGKAMCYTHRLQAQGIPNPGVTGRTKSFGPPSPRAILEDGLRSPDPQIRHRSAIELLAEERRERAERQDIDADDQAWAVFKAAVTPDEIREMNQLANQLRLAKARVYQRCPEARPASYVAPTHVGTNDYAPGTLYLHPSAHSVCEAAAIDVPAPTSTTVEAAEDHDLLDGEDDDFEEEV